MPLGKTLQSIFVRLTAQAATLSGLLPGRHTGGHVLVIRSGEVQVLALSGRSSIQRARVPLQGPESQQITEAVKQALASAGIKAKRFAVAIPTQEVLLRFFTIPNLPKAEWDIAIPFEARKFIPFKTETLIWDYRVNPTPDDSHLEVVFAAIQQEAYSRLVGAVQRAGVQPTLVEPRTVGLARLISRGKEAVAGEFVCAADIEAGAVHIAIVKGGTPYLTRDVVLSEPAGTEPAAGLEARAQRLVSELSVSMDFFLREYPGTIVSRVCLFGEETVVAGWTGPLADALHRPVELGTSLLQAQGYEGVPLSFASALGLAQARGGDARGLDFLKRSQAKAALVSTADTMRHMTTGGRSIALSVQPVHVGLGAAVAAALLAALWLTGAAQVNQMRRQLQALTAARADVGYDALRDLSEETLKPLQEQAKIQLGLLKRIVNERISVAVQLETLATSLPEGVWLTNVAYEGELDAMGRTLPKLTIRGACYLNQPDQEVAAIQELERRIRAGQGPAAPLNVTRLGQIDAAAVASAGTAYRTFQLTCAAERRS